ncbi:MAG: hypothetical protein FWG48_02800 [Oscillospiraceae bacterium]|nr:hypothetical protein [Oscillospiraceae bacterium]
MDSNQNNQGKKSNPADRVGSFSERAGSNLAERVKRPSGDAGNPADRVGSFSERAGSNLAERVKRPSEEAGTLAERMGAKFAEKGISPNIGSVPGKPSSSGAAPQDPRMKVKKD